jgi:crossover junction endodeoxyribonuclease RusA
MIQLPYPPANNRYYRHFRGMTVLSKEGKAFKIEAAWRCQAGGMRPLDGNVELHAILHPRQNKDGSPSKVRVDLDAILKATCDSLNGVGYHDDKQITRIVAEIGAPVVGGAVSIQVSSIKGG